MLGFLRRQIQLLLQNCRMHSLWGEWNKIKPENVTKTCSRPPRKLVILPCDPWSVIGSRGDEAMMLAIIDKVKDSESSLQVGIVTASDEASQICKKMGFEPLQIWNANWSLADVSEGIEMFGAEGVVLLGADAIDGYYSVITTARLLLTIDIMARKGLLCAVSGFSFREKAAPELSSVFNRLTGDLALNVRDPVSMQRFKRFSKTQAQQVADVAFLLKPDVTPCVESIRDWVETRKKVGDIVLAFNMHPLLIKNATDEDLQKLIMAGVRAIEKVSQDYQVSWLLLPHDSRGSHGDNTILKPIYDAVKKVLSDRVKHLDAVPSSKELKAIAGLFDGVIAGRMHLAVASLGSGVPVTCITYQDKFEGLFQHFELNTDLLIAPHDIFIDDKFESMLHFFLANLDRLTLQVQEKLPAVKDLSLKNLAPFL